MRAAKDLHFNKNMEALKKMQAGADKLATVVGVTLGPKVRMPRGGSRAAGAAKYKQRTQDSRLGLPARSCWGLNCLAATTAANRISCMHACSRAPPSNSSAIAACRQAQQMYYTRPSPPSAMHRYTHDV